VTVSIEDVLDNTCCLMSQFYLLRIASVFLIEKLCKLAAEDFLVKDESDEVQVDVSLGIKNIFIKELLAKSWDLLERVVFPRCLLM
jgi:hypothetical protein